MSNGRLMAERMARSDLMTDWGARPLSTTSPLFDPLHYNNGAVWGFVTGWVSTAQFRYGNPHAGWQALRAIAATTFDEARGRNPEVISGRLYKPLDTAVPQQFFATSMILTPLLRGMLGLEVDAPAGRLTVAPWVPPTSEQLRVENLSVGGARLTLVVTDAGDGQVTLDVSADRAAPLTSALTVRFAPPGRGTVEGVLAAGAATLHLRVAAPRTWAVYLPVQPARIGERSASARIVAERRDGAEYRVTVEAPAGAVVRLWVQAPAGAKVRGDEGGGPVGGMGRDAMSGAMPSARFAAHAAMLDVQMPSAGADVDGYVRREIKLR
jgi:hypothetical protein